MKKLFIFAGIIFLCVLLLTGWFFIGKLGNWANFLGESSENLMNNEIKKFIGTWYTDTQTDPYGFSFFANSTYKSYSRGQNTPPTVHTGTFTIINGKLLLTGYGFSNSIEYVFSNNNTALTLGNITYIKQ